VLIHLCVYSRTRDCECAKPYMCAHTQKKKKKQRKKSLFWFSLTSAHLRERFLELQSLVKTKMAKRDWRGTGAWERRSHWEGSWKHRACGFPLSTAAFTCVWLSYFFSWYQSFLLSFFSCSLVHSQRRLSQLVVLTAFCGNVCVSLSLDVCFAPVLVMLLLGCGKIINMGCRLGEGGSWNTYYATATFLDPL